jgi:hypothetical protein
MDVKKIRKKAVGTVRQKQNSVVGLGIIFLLLAGFVVTQTGLFESGQAFYNPDIDFNGKPLQWIDAGNTELRNISCTTNPLPDDYNGPQKTIKVIYPNKGLYYVLANEPGKTYEIDFGDGSPNAGQTVPNYSEGDSVPVGDTHPMFYHTYNSIGTYTATLTVDGVIIDTEIVNITSVTPTESIYKDGCPVLQTTQRTWYEQMWYEFKDWWSHLFNPKTYDGVSTVVSSQEESLLKIVVNDKTVSSEYTGAFNSSYGYLWSYQGDSMPSGTGLIPSIPTDAPKHTYTFREYGTKKVTLQVFLKIPQEFGYSMGEIVFQGSKDVVLTAPVVIPVDPTCTDYNVYEYRESKPLAGCTVFVKNTCLDYATIWEVGLHQFDTMEKCTTYKNSVANTYTKYWYDNTTKSTGCQVATRTEGVAYMYQGLYEFDTMTACENARTSNIANDNDNNGGNDTTTTPTFFQKIYSAIAGFFKWLFGGK